MKLKQDDNNDNNNNNNNNNNDNRHQPLIYSIVDKTLSEIYLFCKGKKYLTTLYLPSNQLDFCVMNKIFDLPSFSSLKLLTQLVKRRSF